MAEIATALPFTPLTANEIAGDPGPRSGTVHLVPSQKTLPAAITVANYGDDIILDHTVVNTDVIREEWGDYASRTINASTPRQVMPSQLRRLKETLTGTESSFEDVVRVHPSLTAQAVTLQTVAPQGRPSYIRIMSDGAYPPPGTRVTKADAGQLARVAGTTAGNTIGRGLIAKRSHRYFWWEGIRITPAVNLNRTDTGGPNYASAYFINDAGTWFSNRDRPQHWVFHRCLIDSDVEGLGSGNAWTRVCVWGGIGLGYVDCGAYNIYGPARPGDPGVFQLSEEGGGLHLVNCYTEGNSALVFAGGTGGGQAGTNTEHVLVQRVHFRKPLKWQISEVPAGAGGWNVTVAADKRSVTHNSSIFGSRGFQGFNADVWPNGRIAGSYTMYDPTTGRGARTQLYSTGYDVNLTLTEDWPGTTGSAISVFFQTASAVYNSGWPGDASTATTSASSDTVTVSAALPAAVAVGHYFYLNDTGYVGNGTGGPQCGNSFFRRKIIAIAGNRLSLTLDGNWNTTKTFPYSVVWWDGIDRSAAPLKSMHEHKCGRRVLVEDTLYENNYRGEWNGTGIAIHVTSQSNSKPWAEDADIRFRYVKLKHLQAPLSAPTYTSNVDHCFSTGRYHFEHLLIDDLGNPDLSIPMRSSISGIDRDLKLFNVPVGAGTFSQGAYDAAGPLTLKHITVVNDVRPAGRIFFADGNLVTFRATDRVYRDCLLSMPGTDPATSSVLVADAGGELPINQFFIDPIFRRTVIYGPMAASRLATHQGRGDLRDWVGLPSQDYVGFVNLAGGDYRLGDVYQTTAAACTISGATVTISSGTFPTTIVAGTPFRATADAPLYFTAVQSRDSATQVTLGRAYPGTTGAGLTGLFTFRGTASEGTVGTVYTTPAAAATVTAISSSSVTETFPTNGATLGTQDNVWVQTSGTNWGVASTAASLVASAGGTNQVAVCQTDLLTVDHRVSVTLSAWTLASNAQAGPIARASANGLSYYYFRAVPASGHAFELGSVTGGTSFSALATYNGTAPAAGQVLTLDCTGSTITALINGAQVMQVTNTTVSTGTRVGIFGFRGTGGDVVSLDSLTALNSAPIAITRVTLGSGAFPGTIDTVIAPTFLVSGDAAGFALPVQSRDSTTQLTLTGVYGGATGAGKTGVVSGVIPSGVDPGCDVATLTARLAGVVQDFTP
jgi:hypothetical protein